MVAARVDRPAGADYAGGTAVALTAPGIRLRCLRSAGHTRTRGQPKKIARTAVTVRAICAVTLPDVIYPAGRFIPTFDRQPLRASGLHAEYPVPAQPSCCSQPAAKPPIQTRSILFSQLTPSRRFAVDADFTVARADNPSGRVAICNARTGRRRPGDLLASRTSGNQPFSDEPEADGLAWLPACAAGPRSSRARNWTAMCVCASHAAGKGCDSR